MKNFVILLFSFILLIVLVGFRNTYFIDLTKARLSIHFHAVLMFIWMLMLIGQAILIRRKLFKWHILIGKISYVVSPLIIISELFVTYEVIRFGGENPSRISYETFTLGITTILFFALLYFLAIYYRYKPELHMRFMIGTGFILLTAGCYVYFYIWFLGYKDFQIQL